MATDTGTEILAAPNDRAEIRLVNTDEDYRSCSISLPSEWNGTTCPEWFDYLLAGWKGVLDRLKVAAIGFDILMEGCIPSSVGLSSSSSIVCAAALTSWAIHTGQGFEGITREELATLCANAEQYVGQHGDRTIHLTQVLGSEDMAVRFDYFPLRTRLVNLPPIVVFDVLNCGEKPHTTTALREQRFAEGLIAGKLLLKNAGKTCIYSRLKDVQDALGKHLEEMIALCESLPETATRNELASMLGSDDLEECFAEGITYSSPFKLRSVARHVFSEALRVEKFERTCETRDLLGMGMFFNECHESCSRDFECSSKAADKLVARCRMARAYGAHVSGWSGTVVALIDDIRPVFLGDNLVYHAFSAPGASVEFL
ncbi:GHMP kinase protein [Cooperia oncophora]